MRATELHRRAGLSLIELMIVLAFVGLVVTKVSMVVRNLQDVMETESEAMRLEDHARLLTDRIATAMMGCDRQTLAPILSPNYSTGMRYQISLGIENGNTVWSDLEEIALVNNALQVAWRQNPDQPDEQRVVMSRMVEPLLEGEEVNGVDDNGNGLIDEEGLNFTVEDNLITIRISLGVAIENGERVRRSVETTVACRNNPE